MALKLLALILNNLFKYEKRFPFRQCCHFETNVLKILTVQKIIHVYCLFQTIGKA